MSGAFSRTPEVLAVATGTFPLDIELRKRTVV